MIWPIAIVVLIALMIWSPGVRTRWLRIVFRLVGGAAALCALAILGLGFLMELGFPEAEYRTVRSPNGSHEATLEYDAGFLGRDFSAVTMTKQGCCQHFKVYEYAGPADLQSTGIAWMDDSHLQIEYRADPERSQHCVSHVADVSVICKGVARKY